MKKIKLNLHAHLPLIMNPAYTLCDAFIEDAKHYFLHSPRFSALREKVFASAAQLLGKRWQCATDKQLKIFNYFNLQFLKGWYIQSTSFILQDNN